MKAKTYLLQLRNYKSDIRRVQQEIRELDAAMRSIGSIDYSKDRIQSSPVNGTEERIIKYMAMKEKLEHMLDGYTNSYILITKQIDGLDNSLYREILKEYFIENRRMYQIADRLALSEKYVYNCFEKGLIEFDKKYLRRRRK